jgi:putative hydrolase of the HAD superfamily
MTQQPQTIALTDIKAILFDLDDTLYPQNSQLMEMLLLRIHQFMHEELHFPSEEIPEIRSRLYRTYGTTLRGLQSEFQVDMDAYIDYLNDIPLGDYLAQDPILSKILADLPQPKYVFTNSDRKHAQRVLDLLDVAGHFDRIIDIYAQAPFCKPQAEAFRIALDAVRQKPENCLFIDDSPANLATAQQLGMATISVGQFIHETSPHIPTIHHLPDLLKG